MTLLFTLIVAQALLGAFDNFWHHESRNGCRASDRPPVSSPLHAAREFLYAFCSLPSPGMSGMEYGPL